jgi:hypothetical protein
MRMGWVAFLKIAIGLFACLGMTRLQQQDDGVKWNRASTSPTPCW